MELLSNELLEIILLKVPTNEISVNSHWICKRFSRIVSEPVFWKRKLTFTSNKLKNNNNIWVVLESCKKEQQTYILYSVSIFVLDLDQSIKKFLKKISLKKYLSRKTYMLIYYFIYSIQTERDIKTKKKS